MFENALVIGKFLPFHEGHRYLIGEALARSKQVTVVVYHNDTQNLKGEERARWIQRTFGPDRVNVLTLRNVMYDDYVDPLVWKAHDVILDTLLKLNRIKPDAVFSSENYGQVIADHLGAANIVVDLERKIVPVSGTMVRRNPGNYFGWALPRETRAGLMPRVIVVGAESTGTTTLSRDIAAKLGGAYVPEYGREYTERILEKDPSRDMANIIWDASDFRFIGTRQTWEEDNAAGTLNVPLVVGDTDAFATAIWEQRYLGGYVWDVLAKSYANNLPRRDLYLLTDHEGVEFEQDGMRDGEHIRAAMTQTFAETLTQRDEPWAFVSGTREERLELALNLIVPILLRSTIFTD